MHRFSGTSNNGNFEEALHQAIETAKGKLGSEAVKWTLLLVSGLNGGIIPQDDLTVEIEASAP